MNAQKIKEDFFANYKGLSYKEAARRSCFIGDTWNFFFRVWHWSAFRLSSQYQDAFFKKYGYDKMKRKVNAYRKFLKLETY